MVIKPDSKERREYPRRGISALARIVFDDSEAGSNGIIFNISPKGMYIETDASFSVGDEFGVEVTQSEELTQGETFRCSVIWHHTLQEDDSVLYGYGVEFI